MRKIVERIRTWLSMKTTAPPCAPNVIIESPEADKLRLEMDFVLFEKLFHHFHNRRGTLNDDFLENIRTYCQMRNLKESLP